MRPALHWALTLQIIDQGNNMAGVHAEENRQLALRDPAGLDGNR